MIKRRMPVIAIVFILSGCTSLPEMHSSDTYSKMDCSQLDAEIAAVNAHKSNAQDNAGLGFLDVLGAITAGLVGASGRTDLVAQQNQLNASLDQGHAQGRAEAEAHTSRLALLNKVKGIRKCI